MALNMCKSQALWKPVRKIALGVRDVQTLKVVMSCCNLRVKPNNQTKYRLLYLFVKYSPPTLRETGLESAIYIGHGLLYGHMIAAWMLIVVHGQIVACSNG